MGVVRGPWNWWPNMKFQTKESQDWGWGEKNAKQVQIPKKKHTPICGGGAHFHIGRPHHTKLPNSWTFSECFLVLILRWSSYYNMELNLEKCINLTLNRHQSSIRYMDGTLVPRKQSATYLGTLLTDTVDNRKEIMNIIFWFNTNLQQTQTVLEQSADVIKMENQSIPLHHPKQVAIRLRVYSTKPSRKEQTECIPNKMLPSNLAHTPYQRRPNRYKRRREKNTTGSTWTKGHWLFWHVDT